MKLSNYIEMNRYEYIPPLTRVVDVVKEDIAVVSVPTGGSGDPTIDDPGEFETKGDVGLWTDTPDVWDKGW